MARHPVPFSQNDLDRMYEAALGVLAQTGMEVQHEAARQACARQAGARVAGRRVRLEPELVKQHVPVPFGPGRKTVRRPLKLGIGGYCLKMRDLDTGNIRPPRLDDLVAALKLADSYGAEGAAPLTPSELPPPVQELAMYRYGWEHAREVFGEVMTHPGAAEAIFEMTAAMGRRFQHFIYATSPLRIDANDLEMARRFGPRGSQVWCCTMGIMGMTAPLRLAGAFVQSLAELMGLIAVTRIFVPQITILGAEVFLSSTDMRSANFSFARPENILVNRGALQVMDYFGFGMRREAWLHTSAKEIGFQSAAEKASRLGLLWPAGIEMASNLGMLANDECFSFEQFVIDAELVRYVEHAAGPVDCSDDALELAAIEEVGPTGQYLTHDSTLGHWRSQFQPELFDYRGLGAWMEGERYELEKRAREIARERIERHDYRLDERRLAAIDAIYRRAAAPYLGEMKK